MKDMKIKMKNLNTTTLLILSALFLFSACASRAGQDQKSDQQSQKKWYGKKANWIGDSIVYGHGTNKPYWDIIRTRLGFSQVRNYGISGSTMTKINASDATKSVALRYMNMDNDADLIVIHVGCNDIGRMIAGQYQMGSLTDTVTTTWYGACNTVFSGLINKYPTKKIAVITPLPWQSATRIQATPYINALIDSAHQYNLPVLDLYNESGICPYNSKHVTAFMPDGLHPNTAGHKRIADRVEEFIRGL